MEDEDLGVDGRIILEWILGRCGEKSWTWFIRLRIGTNGGEEFLDCLSDLTSQEGTLLRGVK